MADKPTTPNPAEGARPRKRQAPTIDLTATEVAGTAAEETPAAAAAGAEADAAQAETPELKKKTGAEAAAEKSPGGNMSQGTPVPWHVFAAGFAGAAFMTIVLVAVWLAGLVPARETAPAGVAASSAAALNE